MPRRSPKQLWSLTPSILAAACAAAYAVGPTAEGSSAVAAATPSSQTFEGGPHDFVNGAAVAQECEALS